MIDSFGDVTVELGPDFIGTVKIHRPPNNFFDTALISSLAEAYAALADTECRAILLCSEGKHFCAGANFGNQDGAEAAPADGAGLYREAVKLFRCPVPVVAAVQGAAIGGGLGLACSADFRVATSGARFSANFARLGLHQGFGLTVTLPRIMGQQRALELLYTGVRLDGDRAYAEGLCDRLAPETEPVAAARELACEIALSAPLAVRAIRQTLRAHLADEVAMAVERENNEQGRLRATSDFLEGTSASLERRDPTFTGH